MTVVWPFIFRLFIRKGFNAIALWPFIIIRHPSLKSDKVLMTHERIHLRQQLEMLVVPFFIWYLLEYLVRLSKHSSCGAYRTMGFEREAFVGSTIEGYLRKRKRYEWFWWMRTG
jgi:hypothetical protein